MKNTYIAAEHIQQWISAGHAHIFPIEISERFAHYISGLPWNSVATTLAWDKVPASARGAENDGAWLASTSLGKHSHLVFFYDPGEAAIVCEVGFAFGNIDSAYWRAPGRRFMFAADRAGDNFIPHFEHFAEYNGSDTVTAIL